MEPIFLSPEEAARLLAWNRTAVFEAMRKGELESVKLGRLRRIPVVALQAYVSRLREAVEA